MIKKPAPYRPPPKFGEGAGAGSKFKFPSELRLDMVSGDWVVIATGRAKRPETFKKERRKIEEAPEEKCPFCNIGAQEKPVLIFSQGKKIPVEEEIPKNWTTICIPNKYPAFLKDASFNTRLEGPYQAIDALGFHEVVVTKDNRKSMGQFEISQIKEVIDVYQERYLKLQKEEFISYVSIFHNHGFEAGASISHPHSQIVATPWLTLTLEGLFLILKNILKITKNAIIAK